MAKKKFESATTPKGVARYPKLNSPDTTYHKLGRFQTDLILDTADPDAQAFKEKIDERVEQSYNEARNNAKSAAAKKKIEREYPYEEELDEETEEPTGRIIFRRVHKAAAFKNDEGEVVNLKLPLFGPDAKPTTKRIGGGSTIKISGHFFPYLRDGNKAGCSFRMDAVQVIDRQEGGADASAFGFGVEGDGEEEDEDEEDAPFDPDDNDDDDGDDSGDF